MRFDDHWLIPEPANLKVRRVAAPVRVFIVEDHDLVRSALAFALGRHDEFQLVGEAATLAAAAEGIQDTMPDVVLLDIRLPDGNGLDLCRKISEHLPQVRCVVLTGSLIHTSAAEVTAAGAAAYIGKEAPLEDLLSTIREVAARPSD